MSQATPSDDSGETASAEPTPTDADISDLSPGDIVDDTEQDDHAFAVVVNTPDTRADEEFVKVLHQTVAASNPDYPDDEPVVEAVYASALRDYIGNRWTVSQALDAYRNGEFGGGSDGPRIYSHPEARLELKRSNE